MQHTLGGENPIDWYRNYFASNIGHSDMPDLESLESLGLMCRFKTTAFCDSSTIYFKVTEYGKKVLQEKI